MGCWESLRRVTFLFICIVRSWMMIGLCDTMFSGSPHLVLLASNPIWTYVPSDHNNPYCLVWFCIFDLCFFLSFVLVFGVYQDYPQKAPDMMAGGATQIICVVCEISVEACCGAVHIKLKTHHPAYGQGAGKLFRLSQRMWNYKRVFVHPAEGFVLVFYLLMSAFDILTWNLMSGIT